MRFAATFLVLATSISTGHAATLTTLFSFNGQNGQLPTGNLIADASGNLFGTTFIGGTSGVGTIFRLDKARALTTLVSFNGQNGSEPARGLIADASGNLFGTTRSGGPGSNLGTVFRLDTTGVLNTLVSFNGQNGGQNGIDPSGSLLADASGSLFGTTVRGGAFGFGTVFRLDTTGVLTTLVSFNRQDGNNPSGNLITDVSGNLFGTTSLGGAFGFGTVFKLDTTGALTTLVSFNGQNGRIPNSNLIADASGNLFGATSLGGAFGFGTVFRLDTTGALTTLVRFNGQNGRDAFGGLLADASGNLFGTTGGGGQFDAGTIFRISDAGFNVGAAVPEPATWAMMLFGLGLVGASLRRRQSRSAAVTA